jgi:type I restriction enzyme S subunit
MPKLRKLSETEFEGGPGGPHPLAPTPVATGEGEAAAAAGVRAFPPSAPRPRPESALNGQGDDRLLPTSPAPSAPLPRLGEGLGVRAFPRYPAYKDSGVEWLGEIPAHWQRKRLRFVCEFNPSKSEIRDLPADTLVSFVPMERVGEDGSIDASEKRTIEQLAGTYTYFRDGDVLVAKITPCFENGKGTYCRGLENGVGLGSTEFHVLRPTKYADSHFIFYLTYSQHFREQGTAIMYGAAGQQRVSSDFMINFPLGLPPLPEQRAIAAFLDSETARIDTLIAKQEALIALLYEKRKAVISHAVTKGLDPAVPLKESGVAWLGAVPAHWEVKRLKHLSSHITVGIVVTPSKYYIDNGVPCLRSLNVREGQLVDNDLVFISEESNQELRKSMIFAGDLVSVRSGQPGTTAVVDARFHNANCIDLILIRQSPLFDSCFMCYQLNSDSAKRQYAMGTDGAIQQHFNIETAGNLIVLHAPISEQQEIVSYLDRETARIDDLIAKAEQFIALSREHRSALIAAAVTGTIDVRSLAESVEV